MLSFGRGILSGFSLALAEGGACSETTLFSSFFTLSIIFLALGAKGIFVWSDICISSTETIGGKEIGSLVMNGNDRAVRTIIIAWNIIE